MFRRAVGSLVARRFSPRVTPRMAPARSLHSLRDLPIREGVVNASLFAGSILAGFGCTTFVIRHSKENAAAGDVTWPRIANIFKIKKPTMEAKFERWMVEYDKTYRDEEEKAMRFQLFKAALERTKLLRPIDEYSLLPEISFMADFTDEERGQMQGIDWTDTFKSDSDNKEKGEPLIMKQADTQTTQVRATQV